MQQAPNVSLHGDPVAKKISYPEGYWLNDNANMAELKIIIEYLKKRYKNVSLYQQEEDQTLKIAIQNDDNYMIVFPYEFPRVPPIIYCNDKACNDLGWRSREGSISQRFISYFCYLQEGRKYYDK
jgi:hypothetical protein